MEKDKKEREGGERDLHEKTLEAHNDVFADIINATLFDGRPEVSANELRDASVSSAYWGNGRIRGQNRDVAKYWSKGEARTARFGLENQTDSDPEMPFRTIGYDGASYRDQLYFIKGKNGKRRINRNSRYPVVTLVLYFGYKRRWTGPRRLTEALRNVPEGLKPFVNDYETRVMEVAWMSDEQLEKFTSDFRIVADFFVQMRKNGRYVPVKREMIHVSETLGLLSAITGDKRFEGTMELKEGEEEPKTMCEVLDRIENRGIRKGRQEGRREGIREGRREGERQGRVAEYVALRREDGYGVEAIIQGLMKRFQLTNEQAAEYVSK